MLYISLGPLRLRFCKAGMSHVVPQDPEDSLEYAATKEQMDEQVIKTGAGAEARLRRPCSAFPIAPLCQAGCGMLQAAEYSRAGTPQFFATCKPAALDPPWASPLPSMEKKPENHPGLNILESCEVRRRRTWYGTYVGISLVRPAPQEGLAAAWLAPASHPAPCQDPVPPPSPLHTPASLFTLPPFLPPLEFLLENIPCQCRKQTCGKLLPIHPQWH